MNAIYAVASRRQAWTAGFLMIAMALTVGIALGFQHIGGYIPCKLCLAQRVPYYVGIPLMALALVSARLAWPPLLTRLVLVAGAALMAYGLYLAVYHAGVEWAWWQGPTDCGVVDAVETGGGGVLDAINTVIPPSCDKAALRVLGLSFAGWNALVSLVLLGVALRGAAARA